MRATEARLSPYSLFAIAKLAEIYECDEDEVIDRLLWAWCCDHTEYLTDAQAGIEHFRAERETTVEL